MRYWLIALIRDDLEHCIELGTFGRKHASKLVDVAIGDGIVCYACREAKIIAIGKVTHGYYVDQTSIFKCQEGRSRKEVEPFEHRIDFSAKMLRTPIDFRELIPKLNFIKKPESWHAYIRRGFAEISAKDWDLINSKGKEPSRISG